jgi:hypothetical protein
LSIIFSAQGFRTFVKITKGTNHCTKDVFEIPNGNYFGLGINIDTLKNKVRYPLTVVILDNQGKTLAVKNYLKVKTPFSNAPLTIRTSCLVGNNIFFAGTVFDSAMKFSAVLIKFNFSGDTLWWRNYIDANYDIQINKVSPSVDGGFLLTGYLNDTVHGIQPLLLIKTDINGNELWRKIIHKSNPDGAEPKGLLQDSITKKIVIVGVQSFGPGIWYSDLLVLDSLGNSIFRYGYQQGGAQDLIQTIDKNYIMVGAEEISGFQSTGRSFALKFNINSPNTPIWRIDHFGPITAENLFYNVCEFPNGELLMTGTIDTTEFTEHVHNSLIRFVNVKPTGEILKVRYYNYAPDKNNDYRQFLYSTFLTKDGGWICTNSPYNPGNNPMIFVKYDANGCDSTLDYCANRVSIPKLNSNNSEIKLWPNPANNELNIEFDNQIDAWIEISNTLGEPLISRKTNSFNEQIQIADWPIGIYFVKIKTSQKQKIFKVIKN